MADDVISGLLLIFALIMVKAMLMLFYSALLNTRTGTMRELADDGNVRAAKVVDLVVSPNLTVTFQALSLIIQFAIATITIMNVAEPVIAENPSSNSTVIYALSLAITAFVTMILGNTVPEAVGSAYASSLALVSAGFMQLVITVMRPVVFVLLAISKLLSSLFKSGDLVNTITEEEIMTLVDAGHTGGTIEEEEKDMIYSVLQLDQTRVSEMMIPRIDIVAVECSKTLQEASEIFVSSGFSRIPVYDENVDNIKGLLYAKDLLAYWSDSDTSSDKPIEELMRSAHFVPETKPADDLLKELQQQNVHIAIVIDEYGGTAGLVTIEDIIEEIIGDIRDEYDINEEEEYIENAPDDYTMSASFDLDDFNDLLDVELPTEDSDTLGGYIYTYLGRVPLAGETIETDEFTIRVLSVDGRRIRKVHVIRKRTSTSLENDDNDDDNDMNGQSQDNMSETGGILDDDNLDNRATAMTTLEDMNSWRLLRRWLNRPLRPAKMPTPPIHITQ